MSNSPAVVSPNGLVQAIVQEAYGPASVGEPVPRILLAAAGAEYPLREAQRDDIGSHQFMFPGRAATAARGAGASSGPRFARPEDRPRAAPQTRDRKKLRVRLTPPTLGVSNDPGPAVHRCAQERLRCTHPGNTRSRARKTRRSPDEREARNPGNGLSRMLPARTARAHVGCYCRLNLRGPRSHHALPRWLSVRRCARGDRRLNQRVPNYDLRTFYAILNMRIVRRYLQEDVTKAPEMLKNRPADGFGIRGVWCAGHAALADHAKARRIAAPKKCRSARGDRRRAALREACWAEAARSRAIRSRSGHIGSCIC